MELVLTINYQQKLLFWLTVPSYDDVTQLVVFHNATSDNVGWLLWQVKIRKPALYEKINIYFVRPKSKLRVSQTESILIKAELNDQYQNNKYQ